MGPKLFHLLRTHFMITLLNQKSWNVGTSCSTCADQGNHWINLITVNYLGCKYLSVQIGITARKTCRNARQQKSPNLRSTFEQAKSFEQAIYFQQNISLPLYRVVNHALSYFKPTFFWTKNMGNSCPETGVWFFWGGNKCRETGVCFFGGKTGVGETGVWI